MLQEILELADFADYPYLPSEQLVSALGGCPRIKCTTYRSPVMDTIQSYSIRFALKSCPFECETVGSLEIVVLKKTVLGTSGALSSV